MTLGKSITNRCSIFQATFSFFRICKGPSCVMWYLEDEVNSTSSHVIFLLEIETEYSNFLALIYPLPAGSTQHFINGSCADISEWLTSLLLEPNLFFMLDFVNLFMTSSPSFYDWFTECFCDYQVSLNLANQYENNEMFPEALNMYKQIVRNKMYSDAGEQNTEVHSRSRCIQTLH